MAEEKKTSKNAEKKSDKKVDKKADKSKAKSKKSKKNPFKSIASFFKSVKSEGKKVVWAKGKDVLKNTIIVLIVVTIVGLCIYGVDTVLSLGMKGLKNLASTSVTQQIDETTQAAQEETQLTDDAAETEATAQAEQTEE